MNIDKNSLEWRYIMDYVEERINELRNDNDSIVLSIEETYFIRGKIDFAKEILDLDGSKKQEVTGQVKYID